METDLKSILKTIKLNENTISMALGVLVVIVTGILIVNYFKDKSGQIIPDLSTQTAEESEHIVAEGETLWSISEERYGSGYNWVDIYEANDLTSESLAVGQTLTLPEISAKEPTATTTETIESEVVEESSQAETYTVVQGDSLWDISVKAYGDGYKWVEIAKTNNLTNPDIIHVGNVLNLPR